MASVNGEEAAAQMAAAGVEEGLAEVAKEVEEVVATEMEAESGWKRGGRRARAMGTQGQGGVDRATEMEEESDGEKRAAEQEGGEDGRWGRRGSREQG